MMALLEIKSTGAQIVDQDLLLETLAVAVYTAHQGREFYVDTRLAPLLSAGSEEGKRMARRRH